MKTIEGLIKHLDSKVDAIYEEIAKNIDAPKGSIPSSRKILFNLHATSHQRNEIREIESAIKMVEEFKDT